MNLIKVKLVSKYVFVVCVFIFLFFMLKAYSDLKVAYPLTDIVYVSDDVIRKNTILNRIPMSTEAVHEMNKILVVGHSWSELKKIAMISDYVRSKIKKGDSPRCDFHDWNEPIIQSGETFGDCSGYAKLFVMVANHFGFRARVVWLFGHVSAEVFSSQHKKWIAVDVQNNIVHKNEQSQYVGYVDIISYNLTNPGGNISSIQLGIETSNDPTDLSDRKPSFYTRMLILNDGTMLNYCNMTNDWLKVVASYLGVDSIGEGIIYSIDDMSVRHHYLFTGFADINI
jgi:hypothetical protein